MGKLLAAYSRFAQTGTRPRDQARRIVFAILHDMSDRRGFRQNWDAIDGDIKEDILAAWIGIVRREIDTKGT